MSGFHLATGEGRPEEAPDKPRFHPVLGFAKPEEN